MKPNACLCEIECSYLNYVECEFVCDEDECKFMCPKVKSKTLPACQSIFVGLMFDAKMLGL